jgi:hypothetical protein
MVRVFKLQGEHEVEVMVVAAEDILSGRMLVLLVV